MQYVDCKFPNSAKSYCYHWEGAPPLSIGEKVDVMTDRGELTVEVVGLRDSAPPFPTKPIIGRIVPGGEEERPDSAHPGEAVD